MQPRSACQFPGGGVAFSSEFPDDGNGSILTPQIYLPIFSNGLPSNSVTSSSIVGSQPIGAPGDSSLDEDVEDFENVKRLGPVAALAADLATLAEQTSISVEEATDAHSFQEAFSEYGMTVYERHSSRIAAIYTDPSPAQMGYIKFVGEVPQEIADEVARGVQSNKKLPILEDVVLTTDNVILISDGKMSIDDQETATNLAAEALRDAGYNNAVLGFDFGTQRMEIHIQVPEVADTPSKASVADGVRSKLEAERGRNGIPASLNLLDSDIEFVVSKGTAPLVKMLHARGGNAVTDSRTNIPCTSGFTVYHVNSHIHGVSGAGHCAWDYYPFNSLIDTFHEYSGSTYGPTFDMSYGGPAAMNNTGDSTWWLTSHIDLPEYYRNLTSIVSVVSVESKYTMVGDRVCMFGAISLSRQCGYIQQINGTVLYPCGTNCSIIIGNQVKVDQSMGVGGDSGAPFSFSSKAYGVLSSHNPSSNSTFFTPEEGFFAQHRVRFRTTSSP